MLLLAARRAVRVILTSRGWVKVESGWLFTSSYSRQKFSAVFSSALLVSFEPFPSAFIARVLLDRNTNCAGQHCSVSPTSCLKLLPATGLGRLSLHPGLAFSSVVQSLIAIHFARPLSFTERWWNPGKRKTKVALVNLSSDITRKPEVGMSIAIPHYTSIVTLDQIAFQSQDDMKVP